MIRLRVLLKICIDSKSDYSLFKFLNDFIFKEVQNYTSKFNFLILEFLSFKVKEVNLPWYYRPWISAELFGQP